MQKITKALVAIFMLFCVFAGNSCYYDNLDTLNPKDTTATTCDTSGTISYATHIAPIMNSYCTSCHSGATASAGLSLDEFTAVKNCASSGKLVGSVIWDGSISPMPKGASSKISDCSIETIKKWIATNYQP